MCNGLKSARLLKDKEKVKFVIVGDGRDKENFLKQIADIGVQDMFIMIDRQPPERIPELLAACDAAFISFMPDPLFEKTIPAKLQSYMACGMPIIASASGETESIINEAGCGFCSAIGNAEKLCMNIIKMKKYSDNRFLKEASFKYYNKKFSKKKAFSYLDWCFK